MNECDITLTVNGTRHQAVVESRVSLVDFLRHGLGLTGSHVGCEHGACGACTVLVNGASVRGCLMLAVQANGTDVRTVEGLATDDTTLHPLQQAFHEHHALQCGFCTPGMLMTLVELLEETPEPDASEIRDAISGNLCRCTGYQGIVRATLAAAEWMRNRDDAQRD